MQRADPLVRPVRWGKTPDLVASAIILIVLAVLTNQFATASWNPAAIEFPLWAAILGLAANLIASALGVKERLNSAFRTELFIKIGLVLLGASINLTQIMSVGARGMAQALVMVTTVFLFTWWLGGLLKVDNKLRAVMSAAVSICGVSAAIAAGGAVLAKKEQLAYVTTLVILTALPLMVVMPYAATAMGMSPEWAGAWFGGNIDTTAAVVGAGTMYGEAAVKVASIVKLSQNTLIGVAAFLLAGYWALKEERHAGERPGARLIWERFPKFVLGFVLVSVLASAGLFDKAQIKDINALRSWAFTLAFVGIGWSLSLRELKTIGGKPLLVYLCATVFNTLLAFGVAWVLFGR
jgi:uncharacterized integral membrane protein (TIGR00698 family)